jgi:glutaredoxin
MIVYSTEHCPNCRALKRRLRQLGVEFTEKDLNDSEVMASLVMSNIHVMSAPAIQIGSMVFEYRGGAKSKV